MKIRYICESSGKPVIRRVSYQPASVFIQFPSGDTYEYIIYDDNALNVLLKKYKRSTGALVAALKRLNIDFKKV